MKLTGSEHGFVATIDAKNRDLVNHTLTQMMPDCEIYGEGTILEEIRFPIGHDGLYGGLWGHCINTGKSFYTDKPNEHSSSSGTPEGHVKLDDFLAVPVMMGEKPVGQIALANSIKGYSDKDIKAIERIAEFFALAIHLKNYEEEINKSLEEKDILLREIHHRVKNNLQIISSILRLQSIYIKDEKVSEIIDQNQNRIRSMAMIHEKLYRTTSLTKIDFSDYIRSFVTDTIAIYSVRMDNINVILDLEENIWLNIETTIPCALIINELISNSIKHAFPRGIGEIKVEFKKFGENLILIVGDNGIGLPDEVDFLKTDSLGFKIVNSLIMQIDGTIELNKDHGTEFKIKFKELQYKRRI
jgi:two-component sensor histidine kinase